MPTQDNFEDIHTPNPLPARGISYVPAKYWAIAIPSIIVVLITSFVLVVLTVNIYRFRGYRIFEEVEIELIHKRFAGYERELVNRSSKPVASAFLTDSIVVENLIKSSNDYEKVIQRRVTDQEIETKPSLPSSSNEFPLDAKPLGQEALTGEGSDTVVDADGIETGADRGYYVEGNEYLDDYVLGKTSDFPEDEMTIEEIEHIGTVNPARAAINKKCSGCGAQLHCKDSSLPGFLPEELLDKAARRRSADVAVLCRRCHLLKHHNFLLNVNVCPVDYESIMSSLRLNPEALVLLVVDITDISGSIHRQLPKIIGRRRPMIVVVMWFTDHFLSLNLSANKVDLLPPDARCGYLKRFKNVVEEAIENAGFRDQFSILHIALVSARTGYGIEDLITEIHLKYTNVKSGMRNDIYLVGCTNAGKSTLFNALLQSDLCKVRAVDLVERATTSIWPGTTLSLLKFPIMKPSPYRLEMRRRRLLQQRAWLQKEMYNRCVKSSDRREREDEQQPIAVSKIASGATEDDSTETKKGWSIRDPVFAKGMWCCDTPGTVNDQQVLNLFTLDELIHVLPRRLLQPRTALVPVGYSLLIGGVARVDVLETAKEDSVLLTTFASDDLPLNCMRTVEVDRFLEENLGSKALVVPYGEERLSRWPGLQGRDFQLKGKRVRPVEFPVNELRSKARRRRNRSRSVQLF
ncbi:unnamed protein product [Nippostrongylus brasiliensis]|uniref:G domain-containing protein n=1 Tax=Nippostrongylus brasiliensis TaxID=27835 RepID=A0A0N4YNA3_NIPBR|nr:unnamed protein product [Nippostrongylus brasiliensis]